MSSTSSFNPLLIGAGIRAAMHRDPDKIALTHGSKQRSYRELIDRIDRISQAALADLGLRQGENVAIAAQNCIEFLELACTLPDIGMPLVTVNYRLTPREIGAICSDAQVKVIFVDATTVSAVREANLGASVRVIEIGPDFERWLNANYPKQVLPKIAETAAWTIPYTSGTTGQPKGVLVSHRSRSLAAYTSAAEFGCFSVDDHFLALSPMYHGGGIAFPIGSLLFGGAVTILNKFEPLEVLRLLKFGGITGVFLVPTHFHAMLSEPVGTIAEFRRPPLRAIIANAAPLPQALKERVVEFFGEGLLHETYSSTEGGFVTNLRPANQLRKQRCVGVPVANVIVRIVNEAGVECAPEEVGELHSYSAMAFSGYWNRPAETAEALRDGWVNVGDLARRDAEGFVYIVDRKKDMVISGGINIYPREIEEVLMQHPAIQEAAVIGVPDEKWGESLRAFLVLRTGEAVSATDASAFLVGKVASYKIPREFRIVDSLPRNANGKVLKTELRLQ